jgi:hypothetical protein
MLPRPTRIFASLLFAALVAGCPKPPPPPPPPAEPPPPPPKCESLGEHCAAKADTRARITSSEVEFSPAETWIYAMQSSATIAQVDDSGPAIAFLGVEVDPKDGKKDASYKDAALTELCKQLGLAPLKRKVNWKKPDDTKVLGPLKLGLWQLDEAGVRGTRKGPLLLVAGPTSDTKGVVGIGFVPDDDKSQADQAIMKSIESIGKPK